MMIDFGQQTSNSEQEIAALFLTYLPLEPLPGDLANRLKTRVLTEVKNSLDYNSFSLPPLNCLLRFTNLQRLWSWQLGIGLLITLLLMALLYFYQLLPWFF